MAAASRVWTSLRAPNGLRVPVAETVYSPHLEYGIESFLHYMDDTRDIISTFDESRQWPARALPEIVYSPYRFRKIVIPADVNCCSARNIWIDPRNLQDAAG